MADHHPAALLDLVSSFLGPAAASQAPSLSLSPEDAIGAADERVSSEAADTDEGSPLHRHRATATVVVFTKDRPWQLRQLLRSMRLPMASSRTRMDINIIIIARVDGPYEEGYRRVEAEFGGAVCHRHRGGRSSGAEEEEEAEEGVHVDVDGCCSCTSTSPRVRFVHDQGDDPKDSDVGEGRRRKAFEHALEEAVFGGSDDVSEHFPVVRDDRTGDCSDSDTNSLLMFLTDDCLLLEPLDAILDCAATCLLAAADARSSPRVLSYLSRLHPAVTWCQTRGVPCPPPRDEMVYVPVPSRTRDCGPFGRHDGVTTETADCGQDGGGEEAGAGALTFDRKIGTTDWSYPFDLSGGVYRRNDVAVILEYIRQMTDAKSNGVVGYSHPNRLEVSGNIAIATAEESTRRVRQADSNVQESSDLTPIVRRCNLNAAPTRPQLVVLAINRVQDVCSAPLASEEEGGEGGDDQEQQVKQCQPLALVRYLRDGVDLDIDRYRATHFNSSHVGRLFLLPETSSHCDREGRNNAQVCPPVGSASKPALSVLIPIHRGPAQYAAHAMASIVKQPIEELDEIQIPGCVQKVDAATEGGGRRQISSPMQIVLVDDRCTDGSIDEMLRIAREVRDSNACVRLSMHDHRRDNRDASTTKKRDPPRVGNASVEISIDIVRSPHPGIASALNFGLKHCASDLVARMDADDVSSPGRLVTQARVLRTQPGLSVLGMSSLIFCECVKGGGIREESKANVLPHCALPYSSFDRSPAPTSGIEVLRTSLPPSDPGFAAWAMLFTCSISHPTVMFRKKVIEEIGGYDESVSHAEDYDLWNRLLHHDGGRSIASLPNIGLWHRKHGSSSTSGGNAPVQRDEGNIVSAKAMSVVMNHSPSRSNIDGEPYTMTVAVLKKPNDASSASAIDAAAALLVRLETAFIGLKSPSMSMREVELIRLDCDARIGELASLLVRKFGRQAVARRDASDNGAWQIWCNRCPDKNLERISLLCHAS